MKERGEGGLRKMSKGNEPVAQVTSKMASPANVAWGQELLFNRHKYHRFLGCKN